MHCSSHFISLFKKKERKRKREALLLLGENPLEEKTSIVALLQASLHQEKDISIKKRIALVRLGEILACMYVLRWIKLCIWDGMAGVG
uniref:Uncharacterized protein n=1 Tax=Fagus sylvatica TaxID=28930 RepID=A0A2N9F1N4_FAGSY